MKTLTNRQKYVTIMYDKYTVDSLAVSFSRIER